MIIAKVRKIRTNDPQAYAWAALRKLQNVELVTAELIDLHAIPAKWLGNARKQAQQIKYCVIQAREYFEAARIVSLATKPNLLYYGTMSLALAEILLKQSGDSSLDKAREEHRHHGLTMTAGKVGRNATLAAAAGELRATPMEIKGMRRGTFELWHRSAREHPIAGDIQRITQAGGSTTSFDLIFGAADDELKAIPQNGITLSQCLDAIPSMADYLNNVGMSPLSVRGIAEVTVRLGEQWSSEIQLRLHPSRFTDWILERVAVDANNVDRVNVTGALGGHSVRIRQDWVNGVVRMRLPQAIMYNSQELRFMCSESCLNEFGFFYVALFLAGNYARYFPDRWLLDVEKSTPLAMAIEELCAVSETRVPLLALSELERTLFVLEA
jgi:hypothetical protein